VNWNGRRRCCPIGRPPSPLEYRVEPRHARPTNHERESAEAWTAAPTRNGTVTWEVNVPIFSHELRWPRSSD
jgi:hypothetical protein